MNRKFSYLQIKFRTIQALHESVNVLNQKLAIQEHDSLHELQNVKESNNAKYALLEIENSTV